MAEGADDVEELKKIPLGVEDPPPNADAADDSAPDEAAQLGSGLSASEIKRKAENAEHNRSENFKDHFEIVAIVALYGIAFVFGILGLIWFFHLIVPPSWRWLDTDEISRLQNFVTGGIIATIAGGHIKRRMG